jgi:hypothetical protein
MPIIYPHWDLAKLDGMDLEIWSYRLMKGFCILGKRTRIIDIRMESDFFYQKMLSIVY